MAHSRQGRNIAIVGATGHIGQHTLTTLISHGIHNITAIVRPESSSILPNGVKKCKVSFDDEDSIAEALRNQEVLILQLPIAASESQSVFIRAAATAGVKYILPTEFGSDPFAKLVEELPVIAAKQGPRDLIEGLGVSCWIGVVTNPWYDFCLPMQHVMGFDIKARKVTLWDGGDNKVNLSTLARAGAATAELTALPDAKLAQYRNKCFYVSAFHVTQKEILASVVGATGTSEEDWEVTEESTDDVIQRANAMTGVDLHTSMLVKFFPLHFKKGYGGDYNDKVEALAEFGLSDEDFDALTHELVRQIESSG